MKKILFLMTIVSWLFGDIVVVTSKDAPMGSLSRKEVVDIFLKKKVLLEGAKMVPLNLPASHPLRTNFERGVIKMENDDLAEYWMERHYNGITPPVVQQSIEGMKAFLKRVDGSIGYLERDKVDADLKIVYSSK